MQRLYREEYKQFISRDMLHPVSLSHSSLYNPCRLGMAMPSLFAAASTHIVNYHYIQSQQRKLTLRRFAIHFDGFNLF